MNATQSAPKRTKDEERFTRPQPSQPQTITLPVVGMSCAACQAHVERALRQTPGVGSAEVNLMIHTARVAYDPLFASPDSLVAAVRHSGYDSSLPSTEQQAGNMELHDHAGTNSGPLRLRAFVMLGMAAAAMALSMPLMSIMSTHAGLVSRWAMALVPFLYRIPSLALQVALLLLTLAGMALAIGEVYSPAWRALLHRTTNMNTLVALGSIAALLYSAVATFAPAIFLRHGLQPEVYYESVLFILAFLMLGRWLEARAKVQTQGALQGLMKLQPQTARVIRQGREVEVPLASVLIEDTVTLRPGERVPVDGIILSGSSSIDESLLTGESLPVVRGPGDKLIGGSMNYDGALEYRATSVGGDGVLGQMLRLMQEAQASRAPTQQLADRASAIFVPIVLGIAVFTLAIWAVLTHGDIAHAFAAAVAVLVIACPCAMGLAVPAALTVAVGRAAQLGILFKSGDAVERLARVDTVVLDKTGTLTEGKPRIGHVHLEEGRSESELVMLAASLEQRSEHPLAKAVIARAGESGVLLRNATDVRAIPGKGIVGTVSGHEVAAGNTALFAELGIDPPESVGDFEGSSILLVAVDRHYAGYLTAEDRLRAGAVEAIASLRQLGLRTIMLTGDHAATAKKIADLTHLDEVHAGLLPDQKLEHIRALQSSGRKVAMVGDGINDAAALAQANSGIAMGTGADLAREAGGAVLLRADPASIVAAIKLSRATLRTMRSNLGWAVGYNVVGIPIAAGVLYPLLGILLSPAIASAAMALSSVSVLMNSLRLRRFQVR